MVGLTLRVRFWIVVFILRVKTTIQTILLSVMATLRAPFLATRHF